MIHVLYLELAPHQELNNETNFKQRTCAMKPTSNKEPSSGCLKNARTSLSNLKLLNGSALYRQLIPPFSSKFYLLCDPYKF